MDIIPMCRKVGIIDKGLLPKTTLSDATFVTRYSGCGAIFGYWYRFREGFFIPPIDWNLDRHRPVISRSQA